MWAWRSLFPGKGNLSTPVGSGFVFLQFNSGLPVKVLLLCWGPYLVMCIYACYENTKLVSPKIRMILPVLAKLSPIFNALLYAYGNEFYRGGIWQFLTGQAQANKRKTGPLNSKAAQRTAQEISSEEDLQADGPQTRRSVLYWRRTRFQAEDRRGAAIVVRVTVVRAIAVRVTVVRAIAVRVTVVRAIAVRVTVVRAIAVRVTVVRAIAVRVTVVRAIAVRVTVVRAIAVHALSEPMKAGY
ncbi:hypothetical protein NFI96_002036 [Prochilodus magdalenae]|nr:hypothetical protein NFI96_002036 [Prochilodus magdalenae]